MPKALPANGQLMLAGYGEYVTDVVRVGQGAYPRERQVAHEAHAFGVDGSGPCGAEATEW